MTRRKTGRSWVPPFQILAEKVGQKAAMTPNFKEKVGLINDDMRTSGTFHFAEVVKWHAVAGLKKALVQRSPRQAFRRRQFVILDHLNRTKIQEMGVSFMHGETCARAPHPAGLEVPGDVL